MRYLRQTLLPGWGEEGQQKLSNGRVTVIGCGGLGSIVAPYLGGAGVGRLCLIDHDVPHVSNLHRQPFFDHTSTAGTLSKSQLLARHIRSLNPDIHVISYDQRLDENNADQYMSNEDLIVECSDDEDTKYVVNDYCHAHGIPLVYGGIYRFEGYLSFFLNRNSEDIHLRDIFAQPQSNIPTCAQVGVLNTIAGLIGMLQANECIKFFTGIGQPLIGKLLTYDALTNDQQIVRLQKTYLKPSYEKASTPKKTSYVAHEIELDYATLLSSLPSYRCISILENHEETLVDIPFEMEHCPGSRIQLKDFMKIEKPVVFCCLYGIRSKKLAERIKLHYPEAAIYSLKGGLKGLKDVR